MELKGRELVSEHRSYLMGIAIIWIMIHHTQFFGLYDFGYLSFLARIGSCGVDIFLFVSAFGLFYSLSKNSNLRVFYSRRLQRVVPTFVIVVVGLALFTKPLSLLSPRYWFYQLYSNWYVSFILIMYLIYPLIYHVQRKHLYLPLLLGIVFSCLLTYLLIRINRDDIHDVPMLMAQRIPIFILGSLFADKRFRIKGTVWTFLVTIILVCILLFYSYRLVAEYMVYPLFFFLSGILVVLLSNFWMKWVDKPLVYSGKISLELYLVHMIIIPYMVRHHFTAEFGVVCSIFLLLVSSFIIAIIINKVTSLLNVSVLKI